MHLFETQYLQQQYGVCEIDSHRAHVHGNEGTCHPVQLCGSLMCCCFWTTMELYGTEEHDISGFDAHTVLDDSLLVLVVGIWRQSEKYTMPQAMSFKCKCSML